MLLKVFTNSFCSDEIDDMKHNPSSEPNPVNRPVKTITETVLPAAAADDDTEPGSAALVRDVAEHITDLHSQTQTQPPKTPLH